MSIKYWLASSFAMFVLFLLCGYVITFYSEVVSQSEVSTYTLLGITAVSLFSWPVLLARAFQVFMKGRSKR